MLRNQELFGRLNDLGIIKILKPFLADGTTYKYLLHKHKTLVVFVDLDGCLDSEFLSTLMFRQVCAWGALRQESCKDGFFPHLAPPKGLGIPHSRPYREEFGGTGLQHAPLTSNQGPGSGQLGDGRQGMVGLGF